MSYILNKIILGFCIVISINGCHTLDHKNLFFENMKRNLNQRVENKENKITKVSDKEINNKKFSDNKEMAPINAPKQIEKVQKLALRNKIKGPGSYNFNLNKFKNWNEVKLIKSLGESNFIKEEGKLKNYQYYFKECFLDVFLIKMEDQYFVNYTEIRPTKLNGKVNKKTCLTEISKTLN